ncbi:hypothetical protein BE61_56570 [Bradyrhizobium elkanii USDA 61]|nr:hypothetical protein BE61_56570 [Bradyrhizobium elkanii USDA 61]
MTDAQSFEPTVPAVAAELERLADCSPDPAAKAAFLRASRALFQQHPGRRPKNDRRLLDEVENLLAAGLARSEHDALQRVAATIATDHRSLRSIVERLRRRRRKCIHGIVSVETGAE